MAIDIYMNFNGNCREVVEYYAQVFETEEPQIMAFGDLLPNEEHPIPEAAKNLIMHAKLTINGSIVMFSDVFPGMPFVAGNNISLSITSKSKEEVTMLFHKLKEGGTVIMDLQETFWSKCYGNLTDKFGIGWQLSYQEEQ